MLRTSAAQRPTDIFGDLKMRTFVTTLNAGLLLSFVLTGFIHAQTTEKPDLGKQPTLYVVGYAHLDTEWRWEYPQVIDEYLRKFPDGEQRNGDLQLGYRDHRTANGTAKEVRGPFTSVDRSHGYEWQVWRNCLNG